MSDDDSTEQDTSKQDTGNTGNTATHDSDGSDGSELPASEPGEVGDDKLPEDLQPKEDNPLARHPGQTGADDDMIGASGDEERAKNPSANMTYGSAGSSEEDDSEDSGESEGN